MPYSMKPLGCDPQHVALLGQIGEQTLALVVDRGDLSRHHITSGSFSVAAFMLASSTDNLRFSPCGVWYAPILPVLRG